MADNPLPLQAGRSLSYRAELDGIRGLAALLVLIFHADPAMRAFPGGFIGVDLFFVLSGFLITLILVKEYDRSGRIDFVAFYFRRALRLMPALLLLLLTYAAYCLIFMEGAILRQRLADAVIALFYLSNWARAFDIHPPDLLGHTWTLSSEEQFYLLWPAVLAILLMRMRERPKIMAVIGAIALSVWLWRAWLMYNGHAIDRLYNALDTRADCLMIGSALAVWVSAREKQPQQLLQHAATIRTFGWVSALLFAVACLTSDFTNKHLYYWGFTIIAVCSAGLILNAYAQASGLLNACLRFDPLVKTGMISYGLYLWHYPVFRVLQTQGWGTIQVLLAGGAITFLLAGASYRWMEQPLLRYKRSKSLRQLQVP